MNFLKKNTKNLHGADIQCSKRFHLGSMFYFVGKVIRLIGHFFTLFWLISDINLVCTRGFFSLAYLALFFAFIIMIPAIVQVCCCLTNFMMYFVTPTERSKLLLSLGVSGNIKFDQSITL